MSDFQFSDLDVGEARISDPERMSAFARRWRVPPQVKFLLVTLERFAGNETNVCDVSRRRLALELGISTNAELETLLALAVDLKLVKVQPWPEGKVGYRFTICRSTYFTMAENRNAPLRDTPIKQNHEDSLLTTVRRGTASLGLTAVSEVRLLRTLVTLTYQRGQVGFPHDGWGCVEISRAELARSCGVTEGTISNACSQLKRRALLWIERTGRASNYIVNCDRVLNAGTQRREAAIDTGRRSPNPLPPPVAVPSFSHAQILAGPFVYTPECDIGECRKSLGLLSPDPTSHSLSESETSVFAFRVVNAFLFEAGEAATNRGQLIRPRVYGRSLRLLCRQLGAMDIVVSATVIKPYADRLKEALRLQFLAFEHCRQKNLYDETPRHRPRSYWRIDPLLRSFNQLIQSWAEYDVADVVRLRRSVGRFIEPARVQAVRDVVHRFSSVFEMPPGGPSNHPIRRDR